MKIYARKYFRLAPFYYFALFLGWSSCSAISDGPIWDEMNNDFYNCGSNWWAKMLFIGNIYGFQEPTEGCMYRVWSIQCDMQLHLLVPFYCMAFVYGHKTGIAVVLINIAFCLWFICYTVGKY